MKLKLTRPLVFLDIESTGLNTEYDRIVELSMCKLHQNMEREIKTYRYNPTIPIPKEVSDIHGITDEMVKDCITFDKHAKGIVAWLENCDLAGFNSNHYDIPLLYAELNRAGVTWDYKKHCMVDVGNLFKIMEQRTLTAAVKFYTGGDHESNSHGAEADTLATVDVFMAQVERYELPDNIDEIALKSNYDSPIVDLSGKFSAKDGEIILNFGKHKGQPAKNHKDFLSWMCTKGDFAKDTIDTALYVIHNVE